MALDTSAFSADGATTGGARSEFRGNIFDQCPQAAFGRYSDCEPVLSLGRRRSRSANTRKATEPTADQEGLSSLPAGRNATTRLTSLLNGDGMSCPSDGTLRDQGTHIRNETQRRLGRDEDWDATKTLSVQPSPGTDTDAVRNFRLGRVGEPLQRTLGLDRGSGSPAICESCEDHRSRGRGRN